jgi:hypothetical protein
MNNDRFLIILVGSLLLNTILLAVSIVHASFSGKNRLNVWPGWAFVLVAVETAALVYF